MVQHKLWLPGSDSRLPWMLDLIACQSSMSSLERDPTTPMAPGVNSYISAWRTWGMPFLGIFVLTKDGGKGKEEDHLKFVLFTWFTVPWITVTQCDMRRGTKPFQDACAGTHTHTHTYPFLTKYRKRGRERMSSLFQTPWTQLTITFNTVFLVTWRI